MTRRSKLPIRTSALVASLAGLLMALPAGATLRTVEQAYELTRTQVQLPARPDGAITVRPCDDCRPVSLRATAATAWFSRPGSRPAGHEAVLAAFRAAATNPATLVYIYYEPQTRRVNRVVLDVPAPVAAP